MYYTKKCEVLIFHVDKTHPFIKNIHTQNYKYWIRNVSHLADITVYYTKKGEVLIFHVDKTQNETRTISGIDIS